MICDRCQRSNCRCDEIERRKALHQIEVRDRARKLRELMEAQWQAPGVAKPKGLVKWIMPMSLGSDHGREDDICAE